MNDGEEVFTSRIFNSSTSTNINLFAQGYADVDLKLYTLLS
ncbi:GH32 C-terminal domain-containing protein [Sarcina ventriculi]|nr:GH32 C-terminal domain-containing protein [Sarcina ventriculi]